MLCILMTSLFLLVHGSSGSLLASVKVKFGHVRCLEFCIYDIVHKAVTIRDGTSIAKRASTFSDCPKQHVTVNDKVKGLHCSSLDAIEDPNNREIKSTQCDENERKLYDAAKLGNYRALRKMLRESKIKHNCGCHVENGLTPLMVAARRAHLNSFTALLRAACGLTFTDDEQYNVLHMAVKGGNLFIVKLIVSRGIVSLDSKNHLDRTPLMMAAKRGREKIFAHLVSNNATKWLKDRYGNNILHFACQGQSFKIAKTIVNDMSGFRVGMEDRDYLGRTPFLIAASAGNPATVKFLYKHRCNPRTVDSKGNNVLHAACKSKRFALSLVKILLSWQISGIDINSGNRIDGSTCSLMAAGSRDPMLLKYLKEEAGADLEIEDNKNRNVLYKVCEGGNEAMLDLIISWKVFSSDLRLGRCENIAEEKGHTKFLKYFRSLDKTKM